MKAAEKSGTAIGIRCIDGVVFGVEKLILSKMMVQGTGRRIYTVDKSVGMAMAGFSADARQLANKAREESQEYRNFYGSNISGKVLAERLAGHIHTHTLYWYLRPFGCTIMLGSYDENAVAPNVQTLTPQTQPQVGAQLYMIDSSGICYRYHGCAIGKHRQAALSELEKLKYDTMTCEQAVKEVARIIYKYHDDIKDKEFELELSWVGKPSGGKHVMVPAEIRQAAIDFAVNEKEREEMDSDDDDE